MDEIFRDTFVDVYQHHYLISTGWCKCGFNPTKTEEGDRDHARGWSTNADHMRKSYARHLADRYNEVHNW